MTTNKDPESLLTKLGLRRTPLFAEVADFLGADVSDSLSELRQDLYEHLRGLSAGEIEHDQYVSFVEGVSGSLRDSALPEAKAILARVFEPLLDLDSGRYGVGWCDDHAHYTVLPCDQGAP